MGRRVAPIIGIPAQPATAHSAPRHQAFELEADEAGRDLSARLWFGKRHNRTDADAGDQPERPWFYSCLRVVGTDSRPRHRPQERSLFTRRDALSLIDGCSAKGCADPFHVYRG